MRKNIILIALTYLIILTLVIATACSLDNNTDSGVYIPIHRSGTYFENTMLYHKGGRLLYLDYDSLTGTYACSKPNCDHSNETICTAYGKEHTPFIYDDHIYYFMQVNELGSNGIPKTVTLLYKAQFDGSGQVRVVAIDDISLYGATHYLVGDVLYFLGSTYPKAEEDDLSYIAIHLYSIDLSSGKVSHLNKIKEGDNNISAVINGVINDKIYYEVYYYEHKLDWQDWQEDKIPEPIIESYTYDVTADEVTEKHLPSPEIIANGCYFYNQKSENGEYEFIKLDLFTGETQVLYEGFNCAEPQYVDSKLFFYIADDYDEELGPIFSENHDEYYYDFKNDSVHKLKKDIPGNITLFPRVRHKDKYIFVLTDIFDNDITGSLGHISIDDYHNGMDNYELSTVDFSNRAYGGD